MRKIIRKVIVIFLTFVVTICTTDIFQVQAIDTNSLDGKKFALVNGDRKYALTSTPTSNQTGRLDGKKIDREIVKIDDDFYKTETYFQEVIDELLIWTFEKIQGETNKYYIYITDNNVRKYLNIGNDDNITLVDARGSDSIITVTEGTGNMAGRVRLANPNDHAINLYGNKEFFGGWRNSKQDPNDFFYLVSEIELLEKPKTVEKTETPSGTVINLFDYWTQTQESRDFGIDQEANSEAGINENHPLKFSTGFSNNPADQGRDINCWTGSEKVYSGIVENNLVNGYPFLTETVVNEIKESDRLTQYYKNRENYKAESLAYLFDPDEKLDNFRKTYRNVGGLLQVDEKGYYYYDSQKNFAELKDDGKSFTLYQDKGILTGGSSPNGQFFPFNKFLESVNNVSTSTEINHYFGMTLTSRFIQRYDGYTNVTKNTATTFEFAGDDDVWIFIDDVLVADLGGNHNRAFVNINFASGDVVINENSTKFQKKTTIYDQFVAAGKENEVQWNENKTTFANNTYHTMKFYYLERGNYDSNLHLKYNLKQLPDSGIYKVDQYGNPLPNAKFAIYAANKDYNFLNNKNGHIVNTPTSYKYDEAGNIIDAKGNILVKALYCDKTNEKGEMTFTDDDKMPYTLNELIKLFGKQFILREIEAPPGYRLLNRNINMSITDEILVCNNSYETGVYTTPTLQMIAPNHLKRINSDSIIEFYTNDNEVNGTLFAVILKYTGEENEAELAKQKNWSPVYGTDEEGYTVVDVKNGTDEQEKKFNGNFISAAIYAAKKYEYKEGKYENVFRLSPSGQMEASLTNMPGDVTKYYFMLDKYDKNNISKTKYTIGYYWTNANSLDDATADNTYRIDADYVASSSSTSTSYEIVRFFGATIEVPNIYNRIIVQKRNDEGDLVNGAKFGLYEVVEESNQIYYKSDDGNFLLTADADDFNKGNASLNGKPGRYIINENTGNIKVTIDGKEYIIEPKLVEETTNAKDKVGADAGTAIFEGPKIIAGKYYIREISPPTGYRLNTTEIMVLVTSNAIYVNSGSANDGVLAGRGPGYVVSPMKRFASIGQINNTLSWTYMLLKISKFSESFADVNSKNYEDNWRYIKEDGASNFDEDTTNNRSEAIASYLEYTESNVDGFVFNYNINKNRDGLNLPNSLKNSGARRLYTDVGWSYLEIFQDFEYGETQCGPDIKYDNLKYEADNKTLRDISHLFSRSTYIMVNDQPEKLKIKKVDADNSETTLEGAEFTLTRAVNGETYHANYNSTYESITWEKESTNTLITDTDGTISIKSGLLDGEYTLTETKAPDGYAILQKETKFTIKNGVISGVNIDIDEEDGKVVSVMTIKNQKAGTFSFKKTDSGGNSLSGAYFALYKLNCNLEHNHTNILVELDEKGDIANDFEDKSCYIEKSTATSDKNGKVTFDGLILNETYRLIEYKAPDGYALPKGQWDIKLTEDGSGNFTYSIVGTNNKQPPAFKLENGEYSVINYRPGEFPLTGFSGLMKMMLIGCFIMVLAIIWYFIVKKRSKKENRGNDTNLNGIIKKIRRKFNMKKIFYKFIALAMTLVLSVMK